MEPLWWNNTILGLLERIVTCNFYLTCSIEIILTNQIVYQTCLVTLDGPDEESCSIMKQTGAADNETLAIYLEQKVQPYAATVTMTIVLLTSVVPALVALFLGPWSDKFGRKPVIAIASTGNV